MFNRLPLEMFFSGLIWVVLIFIEKLIKLDSPHNSTYSKMSPTNKLKIHKQLLKMILGILMMGLLIFIDKY